MKIFVIFAALLAVACGEYVSYEGYKVYNVVPKTLREVSVLKLFDLSKDVDFWSEIRMLEVPISIMIAPKVQNAFTSILDLNRIEYSVFIENVESLVQEERTQQAKAPKVEKGRISFTEYHRYGTIVDYLVQLSQDYPSIVTLEYFTDTLEGRPLAAIRISTGGTDKPIILVDGGIHAREWIAPAVVLNIIYQLIENPDNRDLIETVDWYIIPVLNPDGYEFSHTDERMWRKTRRLGTVCNGVDPNRNFDFHWMLTGASDWECAEDFAGPYPFSEPECVGLANVTLRDADRIKLYLTFHSFGQYLLYPWGWTSALPDNVDQLHGLAVDVEAAIASVAGTRYTIGSSTNVLYAAAGGSDDWVKGVGGVELSYTIELPGGGYGFILPPSWIIPVNEETWPGVVVYHNYVANRYGRKA